MKNIAFKVNFTRLQIYLVMIIFYSLSFQDAKAQYTPNQEFGIFGGTAYYIGDLNCHQLSHRSYSYNDNQMSFCARDTGIFIGLVLGFMYASRKKTILTLPLVIAALIPIGLDGTIQLLTDYESTNPKRLITGLIAGMATGIAIKIIADSLDKK